MSNHDTMRTLGHIARLIYTGRNIPQGILSTLLANPAAGVALMIKPPQSAAVMRLIDDLPADMPSSVSIEDQGGFWLTWYGQRGGARPGAGRPTEVEGAKRVNVMLDAETVERAKVLGDGNLSAGLRLAVSRAANN